MRGTMPHPAPSPHDPIAWIEAVTAIDPDRLFLVAPAGPSLSYGALLDEVARLAGALAALGVTPGDRVAVQVEKSPRALALYLACLWLGAVHMPLNSGYTAAELDYFVEDAAPALFVADPARVATIPAGPRVVTLDAEGAGGLAQALAAAEPLPRGRFAPDTLAAMLYTSGTTGRPKGAMLTRGNLASNAATLVDAWRFTRDDRLLHALPIFHVHGLFVATNTVLAAGAAMLFLPRFDAAELLALFPRATVLMGVPTFYTRLLQQPGLSPAAVAGMRLFVSGSAPLLAETHRAFADATGHAILERYGMTETGMNSSNPYDGARIPGTVGPPLPGVDLRVVDPESGTALPADAVGMIEVRGPNVFTGYWNKPEKTAEDMRSDGFFITGDLGKLDAAGYLHIVGRGKDLIISGGFNVYPKEVESEIDALSGVVESAVIGVPHPDFGEAVVALVVAEPGIAPDPQAMLATLSGRLAKYKLPKAILIVPELPRNTMAKVQKALLRETHRALFVA